MTIAYTNHARERMKHRGISESEVKEAIRRPYFTVPSKLGRFIAVKKYATNT